MCQLIEFWYVFEAAKQSTEYKYNIIQWIWYKEGTTNASTGERENDKYTQTSNCETKSIKGE